MINSIFNSVYKLLLIICISILILGCTTSIQSTNEIRVTDTNIAVKETYLKQTGTPTKRDVTTGSGTLTSSTPPVKTPTFTPPNNPFPTNMLNGTPVPTLRPEKAMEAILELYEDNGDCEFPCWWGIIPGESTWKEAQEILAPLGWISEPYISDHISRYDLQIPVPNSLSPHGYFWIAIMVEDDYVTAISLNTGYIQSEFDYTLAGLLKKFGPPEEIWIEVFSESMDEPHYNMSLYYPTIGINISSNGTAQVTEDIFTLCPQEFRLGIFPPGITVWIPKDNIDFHNYGSNVFGDKNIDENHKGFYLVQEITENYSVLDFYETYIDPNVTACINVDLKILP